MYLNYLKKIFNLIIDLIIPKICLGCMKPGSYICNECKKGIKLHEEICPKCHKESPSFNVCSSCKNDRSSKITNYEGLVILFKYTKIIKELILGLKYGHIREFGREITNMIENIIKSNEKMQDIIKSEKTIITCVPSHRIKKYFIKGYNQSEILAKNISKSIGVKFIDIMNKKYFTKSQVKLDRIKRLSNLNGSFELKNKDILRYYENIIIIDDITTTGATINELSKEVKKYYPEINIRGIVIARHG